MNEITLFAESDLPVDVDAIVFHLNQLCKHTKFKKGKSVLEFHETTIVHPKSYHNLDRAIVEDAKEDLFAILLTTKPYDNNYFFQTSDNLMILSFSGWHYLTDLSMNNGLVYFIADMLALKIDNSYRHQDVTGCIYDFGWDKTAVDIGMRLASICPRCLTRISSKKLSRIQTETLMDLRKILNDLGSASKWNRDIIDHWEEQISEKKSEPRPEETSNILMQNDFIPEKDENSDINIIRSRIDKLCRYYRELTDRGIADDKKGEIFEEFSKYFFGLIRGWRVIESNANLKDCEIDIIYDISEGPEILRQRMGDNIYVECKNRSKKSDARDISHFIMNLKSRGLKSGIFFSYSGITGYRPDNWRNIDAAYKRIIDVYRQEKIQVLPMVARDIEVIRNGENLVEHLHELLNRFVRV